MNIDIDPYFVKRITLEEEESLQRLCENCSDYYETVEGRAPQPDAAHEILTGLPPNKDYSDKYVLGIYTQSSSLVGVMDLIHNYPTEGIWMIGLLMIDPCEREKGLGRRIHEGLVKAALKSGVTTLRIGVARDNHKAYYFWTEMNYRNIKEVPMKLGNKEGSVIVMHYEILHDPTL